jgi:hypothetical protein
MDDAIERMRRRTRENPFDGECWGNLARALLDAGEPAEARDAAIQASGLGAGGFGEMALLAARAELRLGNLEAGTELVFGALKQKLRDLEPLRTDPDFAPLREDPEIRAILGIPDSELDRDAGWRFDLRFFDRELRRRAVDPFGLIDAAEFEGAVAWLHDAIPGLNDAEILLALDHLLLPLRDGHAYVCPALDRADLLAALPLAFYCFVEGVYVTETNAAYAELAGKCVVAVDGHPIDRVVETIVKTICTDNEQWPNEIAPFRLRETAFLHALGIAAKPDRVVLTVLDDSGVQQERTVVATGEFPTAPLGRNFPFPDEWVSPLDCLPERPLYLRDLRTPFWFERLPELNAVYLQINSVRDRDDETLVNFTERFFTMLDEDTPERLILDLRMNKGGNTTLEWPFLHRLIAHPLNARGRLFVVIGRRTWSAAQNFSTYLDVYTEAIFVGEPTGSAPTFNGESIEFALPWSKTRVNISDLLWQSGWPEDRRPWIPPDLYAPPTFAAYRAGRDIPLEAIAGEIAESTLGS